MGWGQVAKGELKPRHGATCFHFEQPELLKGRVEEFISWEATSNKCIASRNKCLTSSNKKLLGTSALLLVTKKKLLFHSALQERKNAPVPCGRSSAASVQASTATMTRVT